MLADGLPLLAIEGFDCWNAGIMGLEGLGKIRVTAGLSVVRFI